MRWFVKAVCEMMATFRFGMWQPTQSFAGVRAAREARGKRQLASLWQVKHLARK
jgi:hypothetical protein